MNRKRKEQIKTAALELKGIVIKGKNISTDDYAQAGFVAGARWADKHPKLPWVSIKDKLPDEGEYVLLYSKEWFHPDLNEDCIRFGFRDEDRWYSTIWNGDSDFGSWCHDPRDPNGYHSDKIVPTHWCPIPKFQKD